MEAEVFQQAIINFYQEEGRKFPWRKTENDYHALVAELMLQKTSAEQVEPVYKEFVSRYPNPKDVLGEDIDIFAELGLEKRAEYLKEIASFIISGKDFTQENLLSIKGIGKYSANAFLSVQKGMRFPILDSNVERVLRNHFDVSDDRPPRRNTELQDLSENLLPYEDVREYNLGLLDYGAMLRQKPGYNVKKFIVQ